MARKTLLASIRTHAVVGLVSFSITMEAQVLDVGVSQNFDFVVSPSKFEFFDSHELSC